MEIVYKSIDTLKPYQNNPRKIDVAVDNDKELEKQIDELLSTDDVQERIKIWKKYHPNDNRFV